MRLDNDTEVASLPFAQRWQLAEAGFLPYPDQAELVEEVRGRDVDGWFRAMAEPGHERLWIPVLRSYAASMGPAAAPLPAAAAEAHERRRRLEAELAATSDYRDALGISSALHLTDADWRTLYPHLDVRRVFNPPTRDRLARVHRRVERLRARLEEALAVELDELMLALHPLARRVEAAFARRDGAEIDRLVQARGGCPLLGRMADLGVQLPYYLSEDGTRIVYDEGLLTAGLPPFAL